MWRRKGSVKVRYGGSGRGGHLGTPSRDLREAPPSQEQFDNWVVSGGGIVRSGYDYVPKTGAEQNLRRAKPVKPAKLSKPE